MATKVDDASLQAYADLASRLADAAAPVSLSYFRTGIGAENKSDESPVTIADREAEAAMRAVIEEVYPEHGIVGEEHGNTNTEAEFVWVLDPIDGTQAFVTGKPLFGTLIALLHQGEPIVGVMDMPALGERWLGVAGRPTLFKGKAAATRPCKDLESAWLYATSPQMFTVPHFPRFEALRGKTRRAVYGAECQAYGLLASGWVDIVCEDTLQPYDFAALVPIVEGAGGVMRDWNGDRLTMESEGDVVAVGDPALLEATVETLAP